MAPLNFPIRVCFLWTNGKSGYSARGTKVHLYWFMRNWWQSWLSVWLYVCTGSIHVMYICVRKLFYIHVIPTSMQLVLLYLLCLSLFSSLSFFPPTHLPPSFLPLPHTSLLPFPNLPSLIPLPCTGSWCTLTLGVQTPSTQMITSYRPVVLYDHFSKATLDGRHVAVVIH